MTIGNLGQLVVDLILTKYFAKEQELALSLRHVGYFYDPCLLSVVGNDPFSTSLNCEGRLTLCVEVYQV